MISAADFVNGLLTRSFPLSRTGAQKQTPGSPTAMPHGSDNDGLWSEAALLLGPWYDSGNTVLSKELPTGILIRHNSQASQDNQEACRRLA